LDAVLLAAAAPDPLAWLIGILLVILLPVGFGMGLGWLLSLPGRMRRAQALPPAAEAKAPSPGRKPGGKK
jgi:hypothetical protein